MDDSSSHYTSPEDGFLPGGVPDEAKTPEADSGRTVVAGPDAPDFLDLAGKDELVARVRRYGAAKYEQFKEDRREIDDLEEQADEMWTCGVNAALRAAAQTSDTKATTGSTLFFRQVRTLAAQTVGVALTSPEPYRFNVLPNDEVQWSEDESKLIAEQRNNLGRYTRKVDEFEPKLIDAITSNTKRGTIFLYYEWRRETAKRWLKQPRWGEPGPDGARRIEGWDFEQREVVVRDHPSWCQIPNADFYCDRHAGADLQRHNCIVIRDLVGIDDLWDGVRAGLYNADGVEKVGPEHLYRGSAAETGDDKRENAEKSRGLSAEGDDTQTGLFARYRVWLKAPIDGDGDWDTKGTVPRWHLFTFVYDIETGPCIQGMDTYDPDGEFPGLCVNRNPDDHDSVYHISEAAVLYGNYKESTTRKNQLFDNLETVNARPLKAVRGGVLSTDVTYGQHKVVWVEDPNALTEMQVLDTSGTAINTLQFIDDDSNRAAGTDRPIIGQPLGGRTSASEAQNIYEQAKQPHLVITRYVLGRMLRWIGRKEQRYWETFGDPARTLQILDGNEVVRVDLGQVYGDFDVQVVAVDEFEKSMVERQNLSFVLQSIVPNFLDVVEKRPMAARIFKQFGWESSGLIKHSADVDAETVARSRIADMLEYGQDGYESPQQGENVAVHYRVAQGERLRWQGAEDDAPNLLFLDLYINECKALLGQQQAQMAAAASDQGAPGPAAPGNESVGEVTGNEIAAAQGAAGGGNLPMSLG